MYKFIVSIKFHHRKAFSDFFLKSCETKYNENGDQWELLMLSKTSINGHGGKANENSKRRLMKLYLTHLANISFSSCSDTNCPKLATNNVEHGALAEIGWLGGWVAPVEPTGLANAEIVKREEKKKFEIRILIESKKSI